MCMKVKRTTALKIKDRVFYILKPQPTNFFLKPLTSAVLVCGKY